MKSLVLFSWLAWHVNLAALPVTAPLDFTCPAHLALPHSEKIKWNMETVVPIEVEPIMTPDEALALAKDLINPDFIGMSNQAYLKFPGYEYRSHRLYLDGLDSQLNERLVSRAYRLEQFINDTVAFDEEVSIVGGVIRAGQGKRGFIIPRPHNHRIYPDQSTLMENILGPSTVFPGLNISERAVLFGNLVFHHTPPGEEWRLMQILLLEPRK